MKYLGAALTLLVCGLLGYSNSEQQLPIPNEVLNNLAGVVDPADLAAVNVSALPVEETMNLFRQKCERIGGPGTFENVTKAQETMTTCLGSLINVTKLQADLEKYKPTGDLDIVFREYCRKSPIAKGCITDFTDAMNPCLEPKERENKKIILNITDSLLEFVCYKEGDRIAIFISAGGPECFQARQLELQACLNSTYSSYAPATRGMPGLDNLPSLNFGSKECADMVNLQTCAVKVLEKCPDPTPANIVDSIFNFIIKVTPCREVLYAEKRTGEGDGSSATTATLSLLSLAMVALHLL